MSDPLVLGRKVFFLYPPTVLEQIAMILIANEFDVYLVRDHRKLKAFLMTDPEALLFINIDEALSEPEWERYIDNLLSDERTKAVRIGIVTYNDSPELSRKYLMEHELPCGFVVLKIGPSKSAEILVKTLDANEAKGRRKCLRATCVNEKGECLIDTDAGVVRAMLRDLSSMGMSIRFPGGIPFAIGTKFKDFQLSVKGVRLRLTGVIIAKREDPTEGMIHVVVFDPAYLDETIREKLHLIIYKITQAEMGRCLDEIEAAKKAEGVTVEPGDASAEKPD